MTNLVLSVFWISLVVVPMAISFPYSNVTRGFALGNIVDGQVIKLLHWCRQTLSRKIYVALKKINLLHVTQNVYKYMYKAYS